MVNKSTKQKSKQQAQGKQKYSNLQGRDVDYKEGKTKTKQKQSHELMLTKVSITTSRSILKENQQLRCALIFFYDTEKKKL